MGYYDSDGVSGLNRQGLYVYEDSLPQLRWPYAARVYKEMSENDPVIGAIMYMAKQLIRKSTWTVKAASDKPEDVELAEFIDSCMRDMETSWNDVMSEIISMFVYGWSFHEVVYKMRKGPMEKNPKFNSKYKDMKIGWRKIAPRAQSSLYGWEYDEDNQLVAMLQQAPPDYKVRRIPMDKGLLFRTEVTKENPEGRSLLRAAYRPWYYKKHIEEIEGIGIERDLAGLPVLTPPAEVDLWNGEDPQAKVLLDRALNIVSNVRRDKSEGLVIPNGWDFKLVSTGGSRQFDTNAIINRYDQRIAITMLSDIVMLGADKVGSFALADVKKSLLAASLESIIQDIASIFNKIEIPRLCELNGTVVENYPELIPSEIEVPELKDLASFIKDTGLSPDDDLEFMNYLRQTASIPPMSQEDFDKRQLRIAQGKEKKVEVR